MEGKNTQQLGRRNTCTPWDAAPVPSSVATWLNSSERVGAVLCGFKTHPNNSEEHLQTWACLGLQPLKLPAALGGEYNGVKFFALRKAVGICRWLRDSVYGEYEKLLEEAILEKPLPEHVAIIMDGNRRYAKKIGISTEEGYLYGAEITERVIEWCFGIGVKQLTIYAFSIENFCRTEEEKERLFTLMRREFDKISRDERVHKRGVRVKAIGNVNLLPDSVKEKIRKAEHATSQYNKFKLFIAVAYSGRMEIVDSVRIIGNMVKKGLLSVDEIDEETISRHLYISISEVENGSSASDSVSAFGAKTAVDLIIRTGGEMRLSNFVPWQALGNECAAYFCAPFWPEFRRIDLLRAIRTYQEREEEKRQSTLARGLKLNHFLERKEKVL